MKGIYEVLQNTWINDKICDSVAYDRELHYGEIPSNKATTYTVDDLYILETKLQTDGISGVWWDGPFFKKPKKLTDYKMYVYQHNDYVRVKWKDFKKLTTTTCYWCIDPAGITLAELGKYLSAEECTNFFVDYVNAKYKEN